MSQLTNVALFRAQTGQTQALDGTWSMRGIRQSGKLDC
jgi:hypothetical protein